MEIYSLTWRIWFMVSAVLGALLGATRPGFMGPGETWVIAALSAFLGAWAFGMIPHFLWLCWAQRTSAQPSQ